MNSQFLAKTCLLLAGVQLAAGLKAGTYEVIGDETFPGAIAGTVSGSVDFAGTCPSVSCTFVSGTVVISGVSVPLSDPEVNSDPTNSVSTFRFSYVYKDTTVYTVGLSIPGLGFYRCQSIAQIDCGDGDIRPLTSSQANLQITTTNLPNATSHQPYNTSLAATGGSGMGYTWSVVSGPLPNGFSLSSAGVLSTTGTPAAALQSYGFNVEVVDSANNVSPPQQLTLIVQQPTLPTVTILDPIPQLLNGPQITSDRPTLADFGRQVQGISADGVSQVVFRIPVLAAGDEVTAVLFSDQCTDPTMPRTCAPSDNSDNDGGVFNVGGVVATLSNFSRDTADATTLDAFIAYRAPIDFVRASVGGDAGLSSRTVYLGLGYSSGGIEYGSQVVPLTILRPPLVFVHGFNTDASAWNQFTPLVNNTTLFSPFRVNYGFFIGGNIQNVTPSDIGAVSIVKSMRQSHLGITYNTSFVSDAVQADITSFTLGANPTHQPVAGVRADIVAHSMGGLIARYWTATLYYMDAARNYNLGYIHKLITLGTPHFGTPQATLSLLPQASCSRDLAARAGSLFLSSVTFVPRAGGMTIPGAATELSGDGVGNTLSSVLQTIQSRSIAIPLATIAGYAGSLENGIDQAPASFWLNQTCGTSDPLASRYTSAAFDTIFDPQITALNPAGGGGRRNNDGSVPLTSALMDPSANSSCASLTKQCFISYTHSVGIASFFEVPFGATIDYLQDGSQNVSAQVENLLNTPVLNTSVWK